MKNGVYKNYVWMEQIQSCRDLQAIHMERACKFHTDRAVGLVYALLYDEQKTQPYDCPRCPLFS